MISLLTNDEKNDSSAALSTATIDVFVRPSPAE